MARYSAGFSRVGINTANKPYAQLRNLGTTDRLQCVEIGIEIAVAPTTAPVLYIARSTAIGTNSATLAGQPHDTADGSSNGTVDSTFSADPTFSTSNFIRIGGLPVTAGGQFIWCFYDAPLVVAASTSVGLVIANQSASGATTGTFAGYFMWDE